MSAELWPVYITAITGAVISFVGVYIAMLTRRDAARKAELLAAGQITKDSIAAAKELAQIEYKALRETIQELREENHRLSERVAGLEQENRELRQMLDEESNQIAMLKKARKNSDTSPRLDP